MNVLALDLGTTTGWALRFTSGQTHSGSQPFKPGRFEGGGMRYLKFSRFLDELRPPFGKTLVVFEEVRRHQGVDAAHAYGGFMATLTAWCEHHKVQYQGVPVGTIKKFATGKGNAGKDAVMAAVRKWGHTPVDDNQADAIALMTWAAQEFKDEIAVRDSERPAPDSKPRRRVPLAAFSVARKRVQS